MSRKLSGPGVPRQISRVVTGGAWQIQMMSIMTTIVFLAGPLVYGCHWRMSDVPEGSWLDGNSGKSGLQGQGLGTNRMIEGTVAEG